MNKKQYRELGKKGAEKRWAVRYETLQELSKFYNKDVQNELVKWPTKYLVKLVEYVSLIKNN